MKRIELYEKILQQLAKHIDDFNLILAERYIGEGEEPVYDRFFDNFFQEKYVAYEGYALTPQGTILKYLKKEFGIPVYDVIEKYTPQEEVGVRDFLSRFHRHRQLKEIILYAIRKLQNRLGRKLVPRELLERIEKTDPTTNRYRYFKLLSALSSELARGTEGGIEKNS